MRKVKAVGERERDEENREGMRIVRKERRNRMGYEESGERMDWKKRVEGREG